MKDIHDQTYYELLEVSADASQEEILKAYNRARATYGHNSPALYSLFNKDEAQELLKLIDEAYLVLSNQFRRKQYDLTHQKEKNPTVSLPDNQVAPNVLSSAQEVMTAIPNAADLFGDTSPGLNLKDVINEFADAQPTGTQSENHSERVESVASPSSTGSTRFGGYKQNVDFEVEIKNAQEYDGGFIQKIRIYKNVSLDQIAQVTKIGKPYLVAVEENNYKFLPAPVFVRGFLTQISKLLGLDVEVVCRSYLNKMKAASKP